MNLEKIATRLGMSISTVSRAMRNAEGVSSRTRLLVHAEAEKMGYQGPSRSTRAPLKTKIFLALSLNDPGTSHYATTAEMSRASIALNISLLSHQIPFASPGNILNVKLQPPAMRAGLIDGIILLHEWPAAVVEKLQEIMPAVSLLHPYAGVDVVGINALEGMDLLVQHLLETRPGEIGFFGFDRESAFSRNLRAACAAACALREIAPHHVVSLHGGDRPENALSPAANEDFLKMVQKGVRSWICPDSHRGELLMEASRAAGLHVPDDISAAIFLPGSRQFSGMPTWTSLAVCEEDLAAATMRQLLYRIESPNDSTRSIFLKPELVPAETTPQKK